MTATVVPTHSTALLAAQMIASARVCAICPVVFTVTRQRYKYCSDECVAETRRLTKVRHGVKRSRWNVA